MRLDGTMRELQAVKTKAKSSGIVKLCDLSKTHDLSAAVLFFSF